MKKTIIIIIGCCCTLFTQAQQKDNVFPSWNYFVELNSLTNSFKVQLDKVYAAGSTSADLQKLLALNDAIEKIIDKPGIVAFYGYMKRVEAQVQFSTAEAISRETGFYDNRNDMQLAKEKINTGFYNLTTFANAPYQAFISTNDQGTERISFPVNEAKALHIRGQVYLTEKKYDSALKDLKDSYKGEYLLYGTAMKEEAVHFPFSLTSLVMQLSAQQKKYDQQLVDLCMGILMENDMSDSLLFILHRTAEQIGYWHTLRPLVYQTLHHIADEGPAQQYDIPFPEVTRAGGYYWLITAADILDRKGMLQTLHLDEEREHDRYGNRFTMLLTGYCAFILRTNQPADVTAAAESILQKHFKDRVAAGMVWYHYFDNNDCQEIKWLADRMDKYPIDADQRKWIEKSIKKCRKYLK